MLETAATRRRWAPVLAMGGLPSRPQARITPAGTLRPTLDLSMTTSSEQPVNESNLGLTRHESNARAHQLLRVIAGEPLQEQIVQFQLRARESVVRRVTPEGEHAAREPSAGVACAGCKVLTVRHRIAAHSG